jgi:hypothetical protein
MVEDFLKIDFGGIFALVNYCARPGGFVQKSRSGRRGAFSANGLGAGAGFRLRLQKQLLRGWG